MVKVRLDKLLSSLGYATRGEIKKIISSGRVVVDGAVATSANMKVLHKDVLFDEKPLDPPCGILILMHKPVGFVCSHDDGEGELVYDLLPKRFMLRNPKISTIGRLDKETSGVLLLSDDGQLIHALTSPKHHVSKVYEVTLDRALRGDEEEIFASGTLMLKGEKSPCLSAKLTVIDETHVTLEITEGRYHQVRRMFAAVGNHVSALHRSSFGDIRVTDVKEGEYIFLDMKSTKFLE